VLLEQLVDSAAAALGVLVGIAAVEAAGEARVGLAWDERPDGCVDVWLRQWR
jgi:hypothetical protein